MKPFLFCLVALVGCDSASDSSPTDRSGGSPAEVYTVRAEVKAVEGEGDTRTLALHHESIPNFKNREGEAVGMSSMVMNFRTAPDVDSDSLRSGDAVEITFEMRWQGENELLITRLDQLPPGTALTLESGHAH